MRKSSISMDTIAQPQPWFSTLIIKVKVTQHYDVHGWEDENLSRRQVAQIKPEVHMIKKRKKKEEGLRVSIVYPPTLQPLEDCHIQIVP
jgi:hypothetical protein